MPGLGIEARKTDAERVHRLLLAEGLCNRLFLPLKTVSSVIFPVLKLPKNFVQRLKKIGLAVKAVKKKFAKRGAQPRTWKEALSGKLPSRLMKFVPSSFDLLGDAAIIEVPDELKGKEKILGTALMLVNKPVESVYMKTGAHKGLFRNEPVKLAAGARRKFATYREHGCAFRISIGKVFFSPRLSTERIRIAHEILEGEKVAALFAGVGPFPIVFAKNSPMREAIAIELNPAAVEDMEENIRLNRVEGKVIPVLGDVKALAQKYGGQFDRVVMPLPKGGENFLEDAIRCIKPEGGVAHYYQFVPRENPFEIPRRQIAEACARLGRSHEVLFERRVREYAPDIIQVVVDFRVWAANR